jgi:uncharacterized repeat protein (TIGR01451 family)
MNMEKNRRTASVALSTILVLLLLLGTPLTMFSLTFVAAAADEDSGGDTTSNEVSTSVSESVTTVDEGNSNVGTTSDGEQSAGIVSDASTADSSEGALANETSGEGQAAAVVDEPNTTSSDGSAETTSDGGQDTAPDTTSDAVSEDSSTNEASSEGQNDSVDEASTASNDGEVGTTSDGEQSAGVVSDDSTDAVSEDSSTNEASSEGQAAAVVDEPITTSSDGVSDGEQASVSDQTSETTAVSDEEEEDPVKILYNGVAYSSPPGPTFTVCAGQPLTFTVVAYWHAKPNPSQVNFVDVVMVEQTSFGVTFSPTSFTLYNPSPDSQNVVVNVPAFGSTGTFLVQIYADPVNQGPSRTPVVAGNNMYFEVNVINCVPQADLSIVKSGPAFAHAGDTITYTYIVSNAGPDAACNVVVSDDVAGTPTYVSGDTDGDGCIDPGETWTFEATYTVQAGDPDPLVNTATVSSDANDPDLSNNEATWTVDILHPAIDVSKSCPQYAHEGDTISYTITVENTGDTPLSNVMVSDPLLGFSWTGSLAVGEVMTFTVPFTVPMPSGDITNTVTASGEDPLGLTVTDTAQCTVDVLHPAIAIDKSADKVTARAGDTITYTIIVTNTGDTPLYGVTVTDTLLGTFSIGTLGVGQSVTITPAPTYTVNAGDPDPLVNTATASGHDILGLTVTATDSWSVDLIAMICGYKFYDANANGVWDAGEPPVAGFKIELYDQSGSLLATTFTAADGSYCFDGLDAGTYTVQEVLPPSSGWMPTTPTSITVTLLSGEIKENNNFGNLCLEPGQGGKTIGYWANAGNSQIDSSDIGYLNTLNLFKPSGWPYPPFTSASQIRNYLLSANARNMWWMLSAQLIAAILNVRHGYLDGSTLVCVDPPACTTFMTINDIINGAIGALGSNVPRATQEYWKNLLDKLNNNQLPFVSPEPCPVIYP